MLRHIVLGLLGLAVVSALPADGVLSSVLDNKE